MRQVLFRMLTVAIVCVSSGTGALAQSELSAREREALHQEIRSYLLENPEVIYEALQVLEDRRNQQAQEGDKALITANADALFNDGFSYVAGNPDGAITIVEFTDYRCGYCKKSHPDMARMLEEIPDMRLITKEFPILGPDSVASARIALAALAVDPTQYRALNDAFMGYRGNLTETVAYRLASQVGYDMAALKQKASSPEIAEQIQKNHELANALALQGTPAFIVGDTIVRGYLPYDDMLAVVKEESDALR